jgi:hypothetical protein
MTDLSKSNLFRQPNIPTLDKVIEVFKRSGGTDQMAQKFYDNNEVTGWFFNGSPIVNFIPLANRYIAAWHKNGGSNIGNQRKLVI